MTTKTINYFISDSILHLVINRPQQRNCLNLESINFLTEKLTNVRNLKEVKAVLIYGEGNEAFSSGADLKELSSLKDDQQIENFYRSFARLIETVNRCDKPVITKIHGYALAGGIGLVAASHIAIASDEAVFALPEITKGLAPMIVMAPIARCIGSKSLAYLSLTGERITAKEAHTLGLVSLVIPKEKLDESTLDISKLISSRETTALQSIIEGLNITSNIEYYTSLNVLSKKISCLTRIQFKN